MVERASLGSGITCAASGIHMYVCSINRERRGETERAWREVLYDLTVVDVDIAIFTILKVRSRSIYVYAVWSCWLV